MSNLNNNDFKKRSSRIKADSLYGVEDMEMPLWYIKTRHIINYILGVIEVLLVLRFAFKLLGANPSNGFVSFLYSITGIFTAPFSGIFNPFVTSGLAAKSVFDPATIIAMIIYAAVAWGLISLVRLEAHKERF